MRAFLLQEKDTADWLNSTFFAGGLQLINRQSSFIEKAEDNSNSSAGNLTLAILCLQKYLNLILSNLLL